MEQRGAAAGDYATAGTLFALRGSLEFLMTYRPFIALLLALTFEQASAQDQVIPDRTLCSECRIGWQTLALLGDRSGPGALGTIFRVADGPKGYWVFSQPLTPKVFGLSGDYVQDVAPRGEGPGEVQGPTYVWLLPGDSALVRDGATLKVFDPQLQEVRRILAPLQGIRALVAVRWPDSVAVNALATTPERFGKPFHILDMADGQPRVRASFGESDQVITRSTIYSRLAFQFVRATEGGFWAIPEAMYDVLRFSDSFEKQFALSRRPNWFSDRSDMLSGGPRKAPSPRCIGLDEDDDGLIWTFCLIASPDFAKAWTRVSDMIDGGGRVEIPSDLIDHRFLYHTRIEVLDPHLKQLVASDVVDFPITSVLAGRRVAIAEESEEGFPFVRIVQLSLRGYAERRP